MKKLALLVCLFCLPLVSSAGINPYIKGNIGYNYMNLDTKGNYRIESSSLFKGNGYNLGLALGNQFSDRFRGEISYSFIKTNASSDFDVRDISGLLGTVLPPKVKQQIILLNGFYYPVKKMRINPFIGAGAGWGFLSKATYIDIKADGNNFAYALYLGVDYDITEKISLDITGNYTSILATSSYTKDLYNFGGTLGIRYSF